MSVSPRHHCGASGAHWGTVPPFVLMVRLLMLVAGAAALVLGIARARAHDRAITTASERYVCPMHAEVMSTVPGDCPICNMALVAVVEAGRSADVAMPDGGEIIATVEERVVARQVRAAASLGPDGEGTAVLYKDDLVGMSADEPALFFGGLSPNLGVDAHVFAASEQSIDPSTVRVRFRTEGASRGGGRGARPFDIGSLHIAIRARRLLVVPTSAMLFSAGGPYVLAAPRAAGGAFTKRPVQIGRILDSGYVGGLAGNGQGAVVVLSGLREGESVIAGYTFFADAERRLREARGKGQDQAP